MTAEDTRWLALPPEERNLQRVAWDAREELRKRYMARGNERARLNSIGSRFAPNFYPKQSYAVIA